jgi:hypothetical protein
LALSAQGFRYRNCVHYTVEQEFVQGVERRTMDGSFNHEEHKDTKNTKDLGVWFTSEVVEVQTWGCWLGRRV